MSDLATPILANPPASQPGAMPPGFVVAAPGAPPAAPGAAPGTAALLSFGTVLAAQLTGLSTGETPPAPLADAALVASLTAAVEESGDAEAAAEPPAQEAALPPPVAALAPPLVALPSPLVALPPQVQAAPQPESAAIPSPPPPIAAATAPALPPDSTLSASRGSGEILMAREAASAKEAVNGMPVALSAAASDARPATPADAGGDAGQDLPAPAPFVLIQAAAGKPEAGEFSSAIPEQPAAAAEAQGARLFQHYEQAIRPAEPRTQLAVEAPVRSPAFANELSEKVVWLTGRQSQVAELTLNPPQMGTVEVRLSLSGADAGAQFFSPNPVVREALENALPRLREMLAQAGIALGDAQVRDEAFTRRDSGGRADGRAPGEEPPLQAVTTPLHAGVGRGLVDLYA